MNRDLPHNLKVAQFEEFFLALHDRRPFRWQSMLMELVAAEGWPELIDLPTASGKTACIDVAVFALAMGLKTPRRIWFVVDRRIVVDEAYLRAERIANSLRNSDSGILRHVSHNLLRIAGREGAPHSFEDRHATPPLGVARLRGGAPRNVAWSRNPAQPAIITSTIDQLGSRLLFRGYGIGDRAKPIHAALAGNDSLIILDEAHLAGPFVETVRALVRFRQTPWAREPLDLPFKLLVMSATLPKDQNATGASPIVFPGSKRSRAEALRDPEMQMRLKASKPAELVIAAKPKINKGKAETYASEDEFVADAANRAMAYVKDNRKRVAVMVNRVATAQETATQLKLLSEAHALQVDVQLLTGRLRPVDRDELIGRYSPLLKSGSTEELGRPIILVTTQCLEVGADFSFDALVTECASLDSLRQRFGRLNRLGDPTKNPAPASILIRKKDIKPDRELDDAKPLDLVYGNALARTWNWIKSQEGTTIDMGVSALQPAIDEARAEEKLESLLAPSLHAPLMLPGYVDLWSQTNPRPSMDPDISLFLHGVPSPDQRPRAEVRVLWRNELSEAALRATQPVSMEMIPLPLRELQAALNDPAFKAGDDLEGGVESDKWPDKGEPAKAAAGSLWVWRNGKLLDQQISIREIRPDDVVILSALDVQSFKRVCPNAIAPPDVYEWAYWCAKRAPLIRYPTAFDGEVSQDSIRQWNDEAPDASELLQAIDSAIEKMQEGFQKQRLLQIRGQLDAKKSSVVVVSHLNNVYRTEPKMTLLIKGHSQVEPTEDWGFETDDDDEDLSTLGLPDHALLEAHTKDVSDAVHWLSGTIVPAFAAPTKTAAEFHDYGKTDERFQAYLAGHRRFAGALLAKSRKRRNRVDDHRLREFYEVPRGFRHELLSAQLAADALETHESRDLILHLIASHHGYCRPFAPIVEDHHPPGLRHKGLELSTTERQQYLPERLDSGFVERFWRLTRKYGWWGLAYLEASLRCADQHASEYREGRREL